MKEPARPADYRGIHTLLDDYRMHGPSAFTRDKPAVVAQEAQLRRSKQYLHIADLIRMKVLFASTSCRDLFGLEPEDITMGTFFARTHPDDLARHNRIRTKTLNAAQDLFIAKEGSFVQSAIFNQPDAAGTPTEMLFQVYVFHTGAPNDTVAMALVLTDLNEILFKKNRHHYYLGNDLDCFRYPDEALLQMGHAYSEREMEVLHGIARGLESDRIADELFLSVNTVNTHRRNIVRKSGKRSTHDVVIELKAQGLL
jgi:DNA-binding CsgD family transcriptional regulator